MNKMGIGKFVQIVIVSQFIISMFILTLIMAVFIIIPSQDQQIKVQYKDGEDIKNTISLHIEDNINTLKMIIIEKLTHEYFDDLEHSNDHTREFIQYIQEYNDDLLEFYMFEVDGEIIFSTDSVNYEGVRLNRLINTEDYSDGHIVIKSSDVANQIVISTLHNDIIYYGVFQMDIDEIIEEQTFTDFEYDVIVAQDDHKLITANNNIHMMPVTISSRDQKIDNDKDTIIYQLAETSAGSYIETKHLLENTSWYILTRQKTSVYNRYIYIYIAIILGVIAFKFLITLIAIFISKKKIVDPINTLIRAFIENKYIDKTENHGLKEIDLMNLKYNEMRTNIDESQKNIKEFVYIASHDLQEPLRVVSSYIQILDMEIGDQLEADNRKYFEYVKDGAIRMKRLIQALLSYSRVGNNEMKFETIELSDALLVVKNNLAQTIKEKEAQVILEFDGEIQGDPIMVEQLLQNIISNGIKFNTDKPVIRIGIEKNILIIKDNGIGIEEKYFDRILEPFKRLQGNKKYQGTGIGMAIVNKVVFRHKWTLEIKSTLGEGTTFIIRMED